MSEEFSKIPCLHTGAKVVNCENTFRQFLEAYKEIDPNAKPFNMKDTYNLDEAIAKQAGHLSHRDDYWAIAEEECNERAAKIQDKILKLKYPLRLNYDHRPNSMVLLTDGEYDYLFCETAVIFCTLPRNEELKLEMLKEIKEVEIV